jgi:transcriptional regulator with XRE-family HTH domain
MGKGKGRHPRFLGKKLRAIRDRLGLSQNGMLRQLGLDDEFTQAELSAYERGVRQPPFHVLLEFSKTARVWVNVLIDDELSLPPELPSKIMHEGISRKRTRK